MAGRTRKGRFTKGSRAAKIAGRKGAKARRRRGGRRRRR